MIQLIVYDQFTSEPVNLDLPISEYIKIEKAMFDPNNLSVRKSDFSQTFRLPFSKANMAYFANIVNIESFNPVGYNPFVRLICDLINDGNIIIRGYLRVANTYSEAKEFEVEIYTEIGDIVANIGDKKLTDLDLSAYDHKLSYANVTGSWSGSLFSGVVVYPIIDWAIGYSSIANNITDNTVGVKLYNLKPAIKVRTILEKILTDAGYTVDTTTTFWASDFFNDQFLILGCDVDTMLPTPNYEMVVLNPNVDFPIAATYTQIEFETSPTFPINLGSLWNDSTWEFTVPTYGEYQFRVAIFGRSVGNVSNNTSFELFVDGVASGLEQTWTSGTTSFGTALNYTFTITLDGGSVVDFRAKENSDTVVILEGSSVELAAYPANASGSILNISGLMPQNSQTDFLKSIINNNNLIIEVDPNDPTRLMIEDYTSWIAAGNVIDWTNKIDLTKDIISTPTYQLRKKDIIYSHQSDVDLGNQVFRLNNGRVFGEYRVIDDSPLSNDGKQSNFTIFAPYFISGIRGTNLTIYKQFINDSDGSPKVIKTKPKIAIYETNRSCTTWYLEKSDTDNTKVSQSSFPVFSEYSGLTSGYATASSLTHNWYVDTPSDVNLIWSADVLNTLGLFEKNYRYMLDQIYSDESKVITAYFYLKNLDFVNIKFNDIIVFKNIRCRLLNIEAYTLGLTKSVKCTLLKLITED